jgi:superfamily II DNA or RNA helicase
MWLDGRRTPSKFYLKRLLEMYSNIPEIIELDTYKYLIHLCNSNCEYDMIEHIENIGKIDVYDLTIKNIPSYIANGFIVHNSGKTFTACRIIYLMQVKTIILVHTNDLFSVWFNALCEQFGESIKPKLGVIGANLSKKDRMNMNIISDDSYEANIKQDIVIATSQTLLNQLDKLVNEQFGLVIVDEAHHYPSVQFSKIVNNIGAVYRLGLSATLVRSDGATPLIWGLLGEICYTITIRELIAKGVLVEPQFNMIVINDPKVQNEIATCNLSKLDLARFVKSKSASSIVKMKYTMNLIESLCKSGKRIIVYTDFVNSENNELFTRDFYVKELNRRGVKVIGVSSDMSGGERSKVFSTLESGKLQVIVFGLLGSEGVDIPRIDCVVMCNGTKSSIRYTQRVGRGLRKSKIDVHKNKAYIFEIVLNTLMERKWAGFNFFEYAQENFIKKIIQV